mmetsp:Transcript_13766/g.23487  ORF Transcript_13766/g.23487 Transcript_13766/m.23487 type:complete len:84 (+) Transcript_13766:3-254(+)
MQLNDISKSVLYDQAKAQSELLALINATVSHEMRNPLNSIINQCLGFAALLVRFLSTILQLEALFEQLASAPDLETVRKMVQG